MWKVCADQVIRRFRHWIGQTQSDKPFVQVGIRQRYNVSEAQLKVLASQRVLSVVLDQRLQAGKVQVRRKVIVWNPALRTSADETVLDPPTAPGRHTRMTEAAMSDSCFNASLLVKCVKNKSGCGTRRTGWSLSQIYRSVGPGRCRLSRRSPRRSPESGARPSAGLPSCGHETRALKVAVPSILETTITNRDKMSWIHLKSLFQKTKKAPRQNKSNNV